MRNQLEPRDTCEQALLRTVKLVLTTPMSPYRAQLVHETMSGQTHAGGSGSGKKRHRKTWLPSAHLPKLTPRRRCRSFGAYRSKRSKTFLMQYVLGIRTHLYAMHDANIGCRRNIYLAYLQQSAQTSLHLFLDFIHTFSTIINSSDMSQTRRSNVRADNDIPVLDDSRVFKKAYQTVGRPPVTERNINDEYLRHPPNVRTTPSIFCHVLPIYYTAE